jgi:hypothetical protein
MPFARDRTLLLLGPAMIFVAVFGLMALFGVVPILAAIGAALLAGSLAVWIIAWAMQRPNDREI